MSIKPKVGRARLLEPCRVMDLDRAGNKCTIHGWDVEEDCWKSEETQIPAPIRKPKPGSFLVAL